MSIKDCLDDAVKAGEIDKDRAEAAKELFDDLEVNFRRTLPGSEAEVRAAAETLRIQKMDLAHKNRSKLLQMRAVRQMTKNMAEFRDIKGGKNFAAALQAHLGPDQLATFSNVDTRRRVIRGEFHRTMERVLHTFSRDLAGRVRNPATLKNMLKEIFGEDSGNTAAKHMAKAWAETAETARLRFNQSGGRIPRREGWGLSQNHNSAAVRAAGFDTWREFIIEKLDYNRMIDEATGKPIIPERVELALRGVWETIASSGVNKLTPSGQASGRALNNRRLDHRFLVFKSSDEWGKYQDRFGDGSVFDTMFGHLDAMSRDIAQMEILGPNPQAGLRFMKDVVIKDAKARDVKGGGNSHSNEAKARLWVADGMLNIIDGSAQSPVNAKWANGFAGLQQVLTSAQLGAASFSAITDVHFQRMAAKYVGVAPMKVTRKFMKLLNPLDDADRRLAVRLGLIAETTSTLGAAQARYVGEISGPEITRRMADGVIRASGLAAITQSGKWAFGMEFMGMMADTAGKTMDQLNAGNDLEKAFAKSLQRYGIGAGKWDVVRKTTPLDENGATFLRPEDIAARTDLSPGAARDLANQVMEMILAETEFAVPTSSIRGQAIAGLGHVRAGTFIGSLLRSALMYKSFAISLAMSHVRRGMLQQGIVQKGRYFGSLILGTTVLGYAALSLKDIAKGRDPRELNTDSVMAAMAQGGGLGIFGDFFFSDVNRFGGSLGETVAGPVVGFASDAVNLTVGNIQQIVRGEDPKIGRDVTRFLQHYTPGGSLWMARAAFEHMGIDQLQRLTDPGADRAFRRKRRRLEKDYGSGYWWGPGQALPSRLPQIGE
ncbi:MAG: hypothetical protein V3T82_07900 [Nitrospinaceae bacterium]